MKSLAILSAGVSMLAFAAPSVAATKVGVVGAANPVLMAESEEGIKRELYAGDTVFMGEKLVSSESGSAQLMLLDRSALMIGPSASITIDNFIYDPATELGEMSMNAGVGAFRFIGGALSKKNPVTIKTPISTMGIRGGIGDVNVGADGQTQGVFHHGEAMTMTNAQGVTSVTTTPGSGFSQADAGARPAPLSGDQVRQQMRQSPVKIAANVAAPVSPQQLEQVQSRLNGNVPPQGNPAGESPVTQQPPAGEQPPATEQNTPAEQAPASEQAPAQQQSPSTEQAPAADQASAAQQTPAETPQTQPMKPATDNPLPQSEVDDLKANPKQILEKFPNGGPKMADYVARGVATDPSLIDSFGNALSEATPAQTSAMGAGMVRGARLVGQQNPEMLGDISKRVSNLNNPVISRTFNAIGPQVQQIGAQPLPPSITPPRVTGPTLGANAPQAVQKRILRTPQNLGTFRDPRGNLEPFTPPQRATENTPNFAPPITGLVDPTIAAAVTGIVAAEAANNDAKPTSPSK